MARLVALFFMVLAFAPAARAEPTSIRCIDEYEKQPYFVTYDLETNHFVLESPVGNLLPGEIIAAKDGRLELSLSASGGKLLLSFDRKDNSIRWPGMPAGEFRRSASAHACAAVTDRTMLSVFGSPDGIDLARRQPVDAFSLRCPGDTGPYFVTLDRSTKTVVMETLGMGMGRILAGDITSIAGHEVRFTLGFYNGEKFDSVWDEQSGVMTVIGIPNNPTRPTKTSECTVTKARSVMELYGRMAPFHN